MTPFVALGLIRAWEEPIRAFFTKFFSPSRITSLRNQITTFTEREDEML